MLFYLVAYLFMNLGAFAVVAFLRNQTGSEDLSSFRGLVYRSPWLVVTLSVFLLSLLGIPPLVGFAAKFQIFAALYTMPANTAAATPHPWLGTVYYALLVIGGFNTVDQRRLLHPRAQGDDARQAARRSRGTGANPVAGAQPTAVYTGFLATAVIGLGVAWNFLAAASEESVRQYARPPAAEAVPVQQNPVPPGGRPPGMTAHAAGRPTQGRRQGRPNVIDALSPTCSKNASGGKAGRCCNTSSAVPLWVGPADRPALAKLRALALAEQSATDGAGPLSAKKPGRPRSPRGIPESIHDDE